MPRLKQPKVNTTVTVNRAGEFRVHLLEDTGTKKGRLVEIAVAKNELAALKNAESRLNKLIFEVERRFKAERRLAEKQAVKPKKKAA